MKIKMKITYTFKPGGKCIPQANQLLPLLLMLHEMLPLTAKIIALIMKINMTGNYIWIKQLNILSNFQIPAPANLI